MRLEEKNYFDTIAQAFDTDFNVYGKPSGILRVERRVKLFIEYCRLKPGLKILEIGCGTGEYTRAMIHYGLNLFATDFSLNMVRRAQKKLNTAENGIFFLSDVELLPLRGDSFDAVLGNSILHHLEVEKALRQIYRVLKKGGRIAFSEPNMCNPQIFLQKKIKLLKKLAGDSSGEKAFYRWFLSRMLERSGFKNIVVRPFDFMHPSTPASLVKIIDKVGAFFEKTPLREVAGSLFITGEK